MENETMSRPSVKDFEMVCNIIIEGRYKPPFYYSKRENEATLKIYKYYKKNAII